MKEQRSQDSKFYYGTLLGAALGVASTLVYQYLARLFNQPRLVSKAVFSDPKAFESEEARALFIAAENLRAGIELRKLENKEQKHILHEKKRLFYGCRVPAKAAVLPYLKTDFFLPQQSYLCQSEPYIGI